jgi:hypothetical protein
VCGRKMDREFWKANADWPRDQEGHVFLGRATERIGHKLFGSAWDDGLSAFDAYLANPLPYSPARAGSPAMLAMEEAAYRVYRIREAAARLHEARNSLDRILDPVREVIAAWAADGALGTALRPFLGGKLEPVPPHFWSTDRQRVATRFVLCRMSWEAPFDNRAEGSGFIFIESKGLQTLLDALTPVELPPYEQSADASAAITAAQVEDLREQAERHSTVLRSTTQMVTAKPVTQIRKGYLWAAPRATATVPSAVPPSPPIPLPSPLVASPKAAIHDQEERDSAVIKGLRAEMLAIPHVAAALQNNKDITKADALAAVPSNLEISGLGRNRVWIKAREREGMPAQAPPGRKRLPG